MLIVLQQGKSQTNDKKKEEEEETLDPNVRISFKVVECSHFFFELNIFHILFKGLFVISVYVTVKTVHACPSNFLTPIAKFDEGK